MKVGGLVRLGGPTGYPLQAPSACQLAQFIPSATEGGFSLLLRSPLDYLADGTNSSHQNFLTTTYLTIHQVSINRSVDRSVVPRLQVVARLELTTRIDNSNLVGIIPVSLMHWQMTGDKSMVERAVGKKMKVGSGKD